MISRDAVTNLRAALDRMPRVMLGTFPTPLDEAPRLSERLGVRVVIKRDDLTGLALGGNKVRKLEFLIADALRRGADTIVTTGGSQSNHARLAAAACRRFDLRAVLILDRGVHPENQGNLLLDRLFGAEIQMIDSDDPADAVDAMQRTAQSLEKQGRHPYVIPRGGSVATGAAGYAAFVPELIEQVRAKNIEPTHLYVGTGSTGTHAGILAGSVAAGWDVQVQGVSVSRPTVLRAPKVQSLASEVLAWLGLDDHIPDDRVLVDDTYRGPKYGVSTAVAMHAIEIAAHDEALLLDPVYTGKVMAALLDHARQGRFKKDDVVVFVHTGGAPALFAYHQEVVEAFSIVP